MWPFKPTNHPRQVLHPKQLELLNQIDQSLVEAHKNKPITGQMKVCLLGIPLRTTLLPLSMITNDITLEYGDAYIPRSVALIVDSSGNWLIYYAIRCSEPSDDATINLFIDVLNRTNNAR